MAALRNVACQGVRIAAAPSQSSAGQVFSMMRAPLRWLKFKNPAAPAVKREAEEDWGKEKWR